MHFGYYGNINTKVSTKIYIDADHPAVPVRGYHYNWYYVKDHKAELCPSPWRVPTEQDFIDLDLAMGGDGENPPAGTFFNDAELVAKYVEEMGFENQAGRFHSGNWSNQRTVNTEGTFTNGGYSSCFPHFFGTPSASLVNTEIICIFGCPNKKISCLYEGNITKQAQLAFS